mgnify:CR=1 FL=1
MTEQEQQRLISGLIKQRESWQPARQRAHKKPVAKRMSRVTVSLWNAFATADRPNGRGGGGFQDKPLSARNHPPPQIFTHSVFFENKTDR